MPHWLSETILAIVNFVPALFVAQDSPHFLLVRAMFGLLFIVLLVGVVAMLRSFLSTKSSERNTG